jgi:hypothetical protein
VGTEQKFTHFRGTRKLHLQVKGKNKTTTCRPAEKIKLADFTRAFHFFSRKSRSVAPAGAGSFLRAVSQDFVLG